LLWIILVLLFVKEKFLELQESPEMDRLNFLKYFLDRLDLKREKFLYPVNLFPAGILQQSSKPVWQEYRKTELLPDYLWIFL